MGYSNQGPQKTEPVAAPFFTSPRPHWAPFLCVRAISTCLYRSLNSKLQTILIINLMLDQGILTTLVKKKEDNSVAEFYYFLHSECNLICEENKKNGKNVNTSFPFPRLPHQTCSLKPRVTSLQNIKLGQLLLLDSLIILAKVL